MERKRNGEWDWLTEIGFFMAGLGFLALAKAKHRLMGYTTPKPFPKGDDALQRLVDYDIRVVDRWLKWLGKTAGCDGEEVLRGKTILELGPGADLGIGLYLLALGAGRYLAVDAHPLALSASSAFYECFFETLARKRPGVSMDALKSELLKAEIGESDRLRYIVRSDFDLAAALVGTSVDVIFSQAAFEHFDNPADTVRQFSAAAKSGAFLIAEIDLQTHSRWIRQKDPNNIYRYPSALYRIFHFRGIPNRVRPHHYLSFLWENGWSSATFTPLDVIDAQRHRPVPDALTRQFRGPENTMDYLTGMLCARK